MTYHSSGSIKKLKKKQHAKALAKHQEKLNAVLNLPSVVGNTSAKAGVLELLAKSPDITVEQVKAFVCRTYAKPAERDQSASEQTSDTLGSLMGASTQAAGDGQKSISKQHAREAIANINSRDH